jgi:sigma-B regulation protein RsbU (phosphoserine phosphatase)
MSAPGDGEGTTLRQRPVPAVHESLEDLYEHAPCGYLSTTPDGTIVKANATLADLTGYAADDLIGTRFSDLLTAGGRMYVETHYTPLLLLQGHAREIALDIRCADGSTLPVLVNAVMVSDEEDQPKVIRTSVFDATNRREYERELLRARERAQASEEKARLLAQTLQASLIPPADPEIPGMDIGAVYRPAGAGDEVGGDFYDVFEIGRREWVVILGDVSGKGAAAAAVTALARYTLRAAAMRSRRPSDVLRELNSALLVDGGDRYCTVVCLRLRRDRDDQVVVTIASGGHPLPLLIGAGPAHPVGRTGTMLGATSTPILRDTTFPRTRASGCSASPTASPRVAVTRSSTARSGWRPRSTLTSARRQPTSHG